MAISETKMQIVIANYFKDECDVNTSIRQAFEKGFRIGVKKGANTNRPQGEWIADENGGYRCSICGGCEEQFIYGTENWYGLGESKFCPSCGSKMRGEHDD